MALSFQMWLLLVIAARAETDEEFCATFGNADCDYCLSNLNNHTCGYCLDDKRCIPGDESGPFNQTCVHWEVDRKSDACVADSYIGFSKPVRIGVGCAVAVIVISTLVFWIAAFPRIFKPKEAAASAVSVEF